MMDNSLAPAILTINLSAVAENYNAIKAMTRAKVAGVVKANSYGLGVDRIAPVLHEQGCDLFFTANIEEGIALRKILPDSYIAVLGGIYKGSEPEYPQHKLIPVINSHEELDRLRDSNDSIILHFDTGMNRLGISESEFDFDKYKGFKIAALMSHFACADEKDHPMNMQQNESFIRMTRHFDHAIPRCFANSSGIFRSKDFHHQIVRPGMALYGLNPTPETTNPMRDVVGLSVRILQTHHAKKGETIGYSATYKCIKDTPLATVAFGYADGILRSLSSAGHLYWKNYKLPIVGRISMDLTTIDLSPIPESERPLAGDFLEFIGPNQSADDIAKDAGTIGYEILTSLGARYQRIYE